MNAKLAALNEAIGWTLVHFLWQGAAIGLALLVFHCLARGIRPAWRYAAGCAAMLAMLAGAAATFSSQLSSQPKPSAPPAASSEVAIPSASPAVSDAPRATPPTKNPENTDLVAAPAAGNSTEQFAWLPWVVALWLIGVGIFSIRFVVNWNAVRRLRRQASPLRDRYLERQFVHLVAQLKISLPVRLLSSAAAKVPMVIGTFKPAVIIPVRLLSGLDAGQLEAIIAHELAHVRRHDYLINLLQNLVEALFFYHPVVWWVSTAIRREREHCCDDIAARFSGGALEYGRALAALEETLCAKTPALGIAAGGRGSLLARIRRLAASQEPRPSSWPAALISIATVGLVATSLLLNATGQDEPAEEKRPRRAPDKLTAAAMPEDLGKAVDWGATNDSGLAAAIDLQPRKESHTLGSALDRSYLVANFGKGDIQIEVPHWLQDDGAKLSITDDKGGALEHHHSANYDDGAVAIIPLILKPGEFVRIPSSKLFLWRVGNLSGLPRSGTYIESPAGTVVILSATLDLGSAGKLATGKTKFKLEEDSSPRANLVRQIKTDKKVIALTFGSGPHPKLTPALLDILKQHNVKATFFAVGSNARRHPAVLKRIVAEGHEVGNLTMTHQNLSSLSADGVLDELRDCHSAIVEACGTAPKLVRPPYGKLTEAQASLIERQFGYQVIGWSVDPGDWKRPGAEVVASRLIERAHPGAITILHDLHAPTIDAMPQAIEGLIAKGYKFATVSELIAMAPDKNIEKPAGGPIQVFGKLVDDITGEPVTKHIVQAGRFDPEKPGEFTWGFSQSTGGHNDGRFSANVRWHQGWTARILADGYLPEPILTELPANAGKKIELTLRLKRGRIVRGQVLDHAGKPVVKASVFRIGPTGLQLAGGAAYKSWGGLDENAQYVTTGDTGKFEISTGGVDRLAVSNETIDAWPARIPGGADKEMIIRLPEPASLTVEYEIEGGSESGEIFFQSLMYRDPLWKGLEITGSRPVKNGSEIIFDALPPGPYQFARTVSIRMADVGMGAMLDRTFMRLHAGDKKTLSLVRKKGTNIVGKLIGPEGVELMGAVIKVESLKPEKDPFGQREWTTEFTAVLAAEDGMFKTERIAPGRYRLVAEAYLPLEPNNRLSSGIPRPRYRAAIEVEIPEGGKATRVPDLKLEEIE